VTLLLSSIEGLMGLKEEQSVWQLFNEGFFIESRFWAGNLLMKVYLNQIKWGKL